MSDFGNFPGNVFQLTTHCHTLGTVTEIVSPREECKRRDDVRQPWISVYWVSLQLKTIIAVDFNQIMMIKEGRYCFYWLWVATQKESVFICEMVIAIYPLHQYISLSPSQRQAKGSESPLVSSPQLKVCTTEQKPVAIVQYILIRCNALLSLWAKFSSPSLAGDCLVGVFTWTMSVI